MLLIVSLLGLCMILRLPHLLTPLQHHFRPKPVKCSVNAAQCVWFKWLLQRCCTVVCSALTLLGGSDSWFSPLYQTYSPSYRHSFISPFLVQHLVVGERQKRGDFYFFLMLPTIITEIKKHCCIHQHPKERAHGGEGRSDCSELSGPIAAYGAMLPSTAPSGADPDSHHHSRGQLLTQWHHHHHHHRGPSCTDQDHHL